MEKLSTQNEDVIPIARGPESKDTLLKDFSAGQRDYILHKLYPIIKKSLIHFVAEATMQKQIKERAPEDEPNQDFNDQIQDELSSTNLTSQNIIQRQRPHTGFPVYSNAQAIPKQKNLKTGNNSSVVEKNRLSMYKTQNLPKPMPVNTKQTGKRNLIQKNSTKLITSPKVKSMKPNEVTPSQTRKSESLILKQLDMLSEFQRPSTASLVMHNPELNGGKKFSGSYSVKNQNASTSKDNLKKSLNKTNKDQEATNSNFKINQFEKDLNDRDELPKQFNYSGFGQKKAKEESEQPKVLNYGGFGQRKADEESEQPKVLNYGGFGQKKANEESEQPKVLNYSGFGQKKANEESEQPKVLNYSGFGQNQNRQSTETAQQNRTNLNQHENNNDSQNTALNYGGFGMKLNQDVETKNSTFVGYSVSAPLQSQLTKNKNVVFNAETQFKLSLLEVLGSKQSDDRIYTMATQVEGPGAAYLQKKRASIFQKNVELNSVSKFVAPVFQKSEQDKEKILNLLRASFLTKSFDSYSHLTLVNAMYSQHFNQNEKIIQYGDVGDKYYILASGFVKVIVYKPGTVHTDPDLDQNVMIEKQLSSEPDMIGFGEIALLLSDKRTATVISMAEGGCDCWVLSGDVFKHIIAQNTLKRRDINLTYLSQVSLFKNLETYEKLKLIDGLKMQIFKSGEFVFYEGATGDEFFIIETGECECLKTDPGQPDSYQQIRVLGQGSHFGEVAILKNVKRTLSVRAISEELKLLVLSREAFHRILGSIKDYLMEDYQRGENNLDTSFDSETSDQHQEITSPQIKKQALKQTLPGIAEQEDYLEN